MRRTALLVFVLLGFLVMPSTASAACDDHPNQASAQRAQDTRDADGDGIYCESLPCPCAKPGSGGGGGGGDDQAAAQRRQQRAAAQRKATARRRAAARRRQAAARRRKRQREEREARYDRFTDSSWRIVEVVDGDTIKVEKTGGPAKVDRITVRLLGIDAPESREQIDCGGKEARATMLVGSFTAPVDTDGDGLVDTKGGEGREVELETDKTQDLYDSSSRLLAYATVTPTDSAVDLGDAMLRNGWADVLSTEPDFRRADAYREAREAAQASNVGLFASCGGNFHSAG